MTSLASDRDRFRAFQFSAVGSCKYRAASMAKQASVVDWAIKIDGARLGVTGR
jgi:hypothetical protein